MESRKEYVQVVAWLRLLPDQTVVRWHADDRIVGALPAGLPGVYVRGTVRVDAAKPACGQDGLWVLTDHPGLYDLIARPQVTREGPVWTPDVVDGAIAEWCGTHANRRVIPVWQPLYPESGPE